MNITEAAHRLTFTYGLNSQNPLYSLYSALNYENRLLFDQGDIADIYSRTRPNVDINLVNLALEEQRHVKDLSKESVELFDDLMDRAEQGGVFSEKDISDLCNLLFLVEKDLENESSYNIQWTLKDRIMEMIIILVIEKESPQRR